LSNYSKVFGRCRKMHKETLHYSVVIIGAGPAGMSSAITLANYGIRALLVDDQVEPGGQIYRNVDSKFRIDQVLGKDYESGRDQVKQFKNLITQDRIDYWPSSSVWYLDKNRNMGILKNGNSVQVSADHVFIATGAQERPMALPGWELPGVMMAGAAQILLKSSNMVADDGVVLLGNGPLLTLLACQYLAAGVSIQAVIDTSDNKNRRKSLRYSPKAMLAAEYLVKGLMMRRTLRKHKVPLFADVSDVRINGSNRLESVSFIRKGFSRDLPCSQLFIHQGVIPGLHMARAAACKMLWNDSQQCWNAKVSEVSESSQKGIFVLGDGAKIKGAKAAAYDGMLASIYLAKKMGAVSEGEFRKFVKSWKRKQRRHDAIRPFLESYFRVSSSFLAPIDETIICRCEEVTAGEIRKLRDLGCLGPNQAKSFSRCGMGPCQGRFCGQTVEQIFAESGEHRREDIGYFKARPPLAPITLGQISDIENL
jgi:thioredoxin reductase